MGRTYICFDADNDIHYYRLMQAWDANPNMPFDFHNAHDLATLPYATDEDYIKSKLKIRFNGTTEFILLVGEQTRYLYKFVRWEIEQALNMNLPIIVCNLNGRRSMDSDRCPPILQNQLAMHISFNQRIIQFALTNWPTQHRQLLLMGGSGPYYYQDSHYTSLGIGYV